MSSLDLHEAIFTTRAMRRLKPDPVPPEDLEYLVRAATQAANAQNLQTWAFVVVTDPATRERIGEIYRELGRQIVTPAAEESSALDPATRKVYRHSIALVEGMVDAPALIVVCNRGSPPAEALAASAYYGSVYPAIQNLMLAARSRGLGTTLTTLHKLREADVKTVLGIPDDYETIALIPVGYPTGRGGSPKRRPTGEVTPWDRWGKQPEF